MRKAFIFMFLLFALGCKSDHEPVPFIPFSRETADPFEAGMDTQFLEPTTNTVHPNEWGTWRNYNYASLWWLGQFNGHDSFMGYGYGGQFVIVFPGLDLIVVATCNNNVPPEETTEQEWTIFELVTSYILPSLS